jgi:hypothetical protein
MVRSHGHRLEDMTTRRAMPHGQEHATGVSRAPPAIRRSVIGPACVVTLAVRASVL